MAPRSLVALLARLVVMALTLVAAASAAVAASEDRGRHTIHAVAAVVVESDREPADCAGGGVVHDTDCHAGHPWAFPPAVPTVAAPTPDALRPARRLGHVEGAARGPAPPPPKA
jgi:cytochrome c5